MKHTKEISSRLRLARQKAGYRSARAFALNNNMPYITYSQHEAGNRKLTPDILLKYASLLDTDPAWLLTGCAINHDSETKNEPSCAGLGNSTQVTEINADLLGDIFSTLNKLLNEQHIVMTDKEKINLSLEFYKTISITKDTVHAKKILDLMVYSIKKLSEGAA